MEVDNQNQNINPQPISSDNPQVTNPILNQRGNFPIIIGAILILLVLVGGVYYYYQNYAKKQTNTITKSVPTPSVNEPSVNHQNPQTSLKDINVDGVKLAFLRDGKVYLYQDGKERPILSPDNKSGSTTQTQYTYPIVSPNGKFLAYIEAITKVSSNQEYGGANPSGRLKIINLDSGETKVTKYDTDFYNWNNLSQIDLKTSSTTHDANGNFSGNVNFVIYDPVSDNEVDSQIESVEKDGSIKLVGFPISNGKRIVYKNSNFYLIDSNKKETVLSGNKKFSVFESWSPSGKYAVFYGYGNEPSYYSAYFATNTENLSQSYKEIPLESGGAGGEVGTGLKWYFDQGFVPDCAEKLYFVDGRTFLQLTTTGGGGCNNSEGFVSTSPNGEFTIVKFNDRFELHSKDSNKTSIKESTPVKKTRFTPKNMIWVGNDYVVMFESTVQNRNIGESNNRIFLYDRKANLIKPIIDNGYLILSAYSI